MYTQLAPLSRDLSGLILPHDHYGSHLDKNGKTCDTELEKVNFQKAGEVLAEVWNSTVIDEYEVVASYVGSDRGSSRSVHHLMSGPVGTFNNLSIACRL